MFTVHEIEHLHTKVKSGADFPQYILDLKQIGVQSFETWVKDSHTIYFGEHDFQTASKPQYGNLIIIEHVDVAKFKAKLLMHQQGKTDYFTFCKDCAASGIEKWVMDLHLMTCIYFDKKGQKILAEKIPLKN